MDTAPRNADLIFTAQPDSSGLAYSAAPPFDPDEFRADLAGLGLTRDQQTELLQVLWNIMKTFVEIGFGVDPVQTIFPSLFEIASGEDSGAIEREQHSATEPFTSAASAAAEKENSHDD